MAKVKAFCRWNKGPELVDLAFIQRQIMQSGARLNQVKALKSGSGSFLSREALSVGLKEGKQLCCETAVGRGSVAAEGLSLATARNCQPPE